jgi:SAM-dependent methyltransferase
MLMINDPGEFREKEQLYISVRAQEGRIYTDDQLRALPDIDADHKHYKEWAFRKKSWLRLRDYLAKTFKQRPLRILDIGCGNGWMTHLLHQEGYHATGADLNLHELMQAENVFGCSETLRWVYADIFNAAFPSEKYDVILLAASCQYFPDLGKLVDRLSELLSLCGQVHLLDSMFYSGIESRNAKDRTMQYYSRLGHPQMSAGYFHHSRKTIRALGFKKLFPPALNIVRGEPQLQWWVLQS